MFHVMKFQDTMFDQLSKNISNSSDNSKLDFPNVVINTSDISKFTTGDSDQFIGIITHSYKKNGDGNHLFCRHNASVSKEEMIERKNDV